MRRPASVRFATFAIIAGGITAACNETTAPVETLAGFDIDVPETVGAGSAFAITVTAVGSEGSRPLTSFSGDIALTVSAGSIAPDAIALVSGAANPTVTVADTFGPIEVTVRSGDVIGTSQTFQIVFAALPGNESDPAAGAIPTREFVPRPEDYSDDHPDLPGLPLSHTTLIALVDPSATVGQVNDVLDRVGAEIDGGVTGGDGIGGILFLRMATTDHAGMQTVLTQLAAEPVFRAIAPDVLLSGTVEPPWSSGRPADWTWEPTPSGGNWGMELIRAPQMWNLNPAVAKMGGLGTFTGILDVGFSPHPDLSYHIDLTPAAVSEHGTHVAGTIAARWDTTGVDGLNPTALLVVAGSGIGTPASPLAAGVSYGGQLISKFHDMALSVALLRVVNMSLGFHWGSYSIDIGNNDIGQALVDAAGAIFDNLIALLELQREVPLIVAAAGNDSHFGFGIQSARYSSPMTNAAIAWGNPHVLVIESDSLTPAGTIVRSDFSNKDGHVSAPGSRVLSTSITPRYEFFSGTSMAAPHVTGVISYLFTLDPSLTHVEVRDVLTTNALQVLGGASDQIDAFASVMDIDRVQGNDRILRLLTDIDDGTADGNQRSAPEGGFTNEDADADGGIGDGSVDMSDFRRWRDWLLQVESAPVTSLDGADNHPKKDVNGNGQVEAPARENVYPRGDFNGDGRIDRDSTAYVPGAVANTVTDLQVLQLVFDDPDYVAADLPDLIESADITIDAARLLALPDVDRVLINIETAGPEYERVHTETDSVHIVTVPASEGVEVEIRVRVVRADGSRVATAHKTEILFPGQDLYWTPDPDDSSIIIQLTVPEEVVGGEPFPLTVRAGLENLLGAVTYRDGITVSFSGTYTAVGGTVTPSSGQTNADGSFEATGLVPPPVERHYTFSVSVTLEGFDQVVETFEIEVCPCGH